MFFDSKLACFYEKHDKENEFEHSPDNEVVFDMFRDLEGIDSEF